MMVRLLVDVSNIGLAGERVEIVASRAQRLVDSGKAELDPPDQEWPV